AFFVWPLRDALAPQVTARLGKDPRSIEPFLRSILGWTSIALVIGTIIAAVVRLGLQHRWLPVNPAIQEPVVDALTWLLPAIVLFGVSEVINGLFACYDRPVWQQAVRLIWPAGS